MPSTSLEHRYVTPAKQDVATEVAVDFPGLLMEAATRLTRFTLGLEASNTRLVWE